MASSLSKFRLLVLLLASIAVLATFNCCDDDDCPVAPTPTAPRFSGDYAMGNWTTSGITGGTTTINPDTGSTAAADFSYDVSLGSGGVSYRTATFEVPVPKSGVVTFDWTYTGFHAWCCPATAYFRIYADGDEFIAINNLPAGGGFTFSGRAAINVSDTGTFGFVIGGENYDSDSRLQGTLTITNFRTP
jgi:hypothetical protein